MLETGLEGRTALVTGGASGIGQSIAVGLATEGVAVLVADIKDAGETLAMIEGAGRGAAAIAVDLRDQDQLEAMVPKAVETLGHVDLFVNVAAVYAAGPVTRLAPETWANVLATNVTACALASRHIAAHMISRASGSILIVGSTVVCAPSYEGGAYRASKVALRSYMETLAIELAPFDIRVNMLTPGPFPTHLVDDLPPEQRSGAMRDVPLGQREGRLEEVRATALFLLSDELASYVTGTEVFVDGGWHLRPVHIGAPEAVRQLNL